jgi:acyl-CoA thioester hydrolase
MEPIDATKSTSTMQIRVRFCETDLMGIVHHVNYLVYFEAGRVEWLRRRGVTYRDWAEKGVHLPVVESHCHYHAPSRFDDVIDVETQLIKLRTVSLDFGYRVLRDGKLLADGWTRLGCIDATSKLLRIPEDIRGVLLSEERTGSPR